MKTERERESVLFHSYKTMPEFLSIFWRISFYLSYSYKLSYFVRLLYYFLIYT